MRNITHEEQDKLREIYKKRLQREKQIWISKVTGINHNTLSSFKNGKIDLYEYLYEKLEKYLLNN